MTDLLQRFALGLSQLFHFSRLTALIGVGLAVAACGGGGSPGNPPAPPGPPSGFRADSGVAQKGPLIIGSTVTVQELDATLVPTGRQFSYQITSDLGAFTPTSTFNSSYLSVNATGYYFDEVLGVVSSGPVTLTSYNDLATDSTLNVNLLTTLAYRRIENLMRNSSMTFAAARAQAEREVLKALNIPAGSYGAFGTLDLKGNHEGDRLLAAISGLFVNGNHAGDLSTLISNFQSDLGTNGRLTNAAIRTALAMSAATMNVATVAANLTQRYAGLGVTFSASDLVPWIDNDGDGLVGKFEFRVPDAAPATEFTLPAALVDGLGGKSITASSGQLHVNGAPVTAAVTITSGDSVAVSPGVGPFPDGVSNVYVVSQNDRVARVSFVSGLLSLTVTPATPSLPKGLMQQFTATGTFSDTSTADLTQRVAWSSSNPDFASISASGLALAHAIGATTITAVSGSIAGSETLTLTDARLESIEITPSAVRSGVGLTANLKAIGTYSDATTGDLTHQATWVSHDTTIATVNAQTGVATGVSLGSTTIEATVGSVTQSAPIAIVTNQWSAGPSAPATFASHTATLLPNGKVIAIGGRSFNGFGVASVGIYDSASQTWSQGASLPAARTLHTSTLLSTGKILTAGGYDGLSVSTATLYDAVTNQWLAAPDMSSIRSLHTATLLQDGRVLIAGGFNNQSHVASSELYSPATNTWSAAASMTVPRRWHTATLLPNGKVLVTGGFSGSIVPENTAEIYDPVANTWSLAATMANARWEHTAILLPNGTVLVVGGFGAAGAPLITAAEVYDPQTNTWTQAGNMHHARGLPTATLLPDGRVLVAGGGADSPTGQAPRTSEFYDPATNTWTLGPDLVLRRAHHSATLLPNNVVLVIGGLTEDGASLTLLNSTESYW